jgi:hypothetical protein
VKKGFLHDRDHARNGKYHGKQQRDWEQPLTEPEQVHPKIARAVHG